MGYRREVIEVDLVPIPYRVKGAGEPVVMMHLPTSPDHCFSKNFDAIAAAFTVYLIDLRPAVVLKTWLTRKIPLLDYLEDLTLKFMDRMGIRQANLIGAHKAGAIAMYLAARHPQRVRKLVLYSTLGLSSAPGNAPVFKIIFLFMRLPGVPLLGRIRWLRRVVKWLDLRGTGQWRVGQFLGRHEPHDKYTLTRHLVEVYTALLKPPDIFAYEVMIYTINHLSYAPLVELIPSIRQQTLLVFGDDYQYAIPEAVVKKYGEQLENSEIILVKDARIYPHYEQAPMINRKTLEFLQHA